MGVPFADVKSMVLSGFKSSFLPFHEKQLQLRLVGAELDRYDDHGRMQRAASVAPLPPSRPRVP